MNSEKRCLFIIISILIWCYVQANAVFNLIGVDMKPPPQLQPNRVENIYSQGQCLAKCFYNTKCYSFAIEKDNLSCRMYNISLPHQQLVPSPNTDYYTNTEFRDCQDWYNFGANVSGVYKVKWMGRMMKDVRCNMEVDGGGWLTFQRRLDGSVDFNEPGTWNEYKNGFGNVSREFWLGNDLLHEMTSAGSYYVLILAESYNGQRQISKYGHFYIDNESNKYQLHFNENLLAGIHSLYNLTPSQSLNNQFFSSRDQDNDKRTDTHEPCANQASKARGPFWYNKCALIWPNGRYCTGIGYGMNWESWLDRNCLKSIEMMIKRM